jgi:hypothetical protein
MEWNRLTTDASRPAVVSSIFLSSNGPIAIVIVLLAAALVVAEAGLALGIELVSQSQPKVRLGTI